MALSSLLLCSRMDEGISKEASFLHVWARHVQVANPPDPAENEVEMVGPRREMRLHWTAVGNDCSRVQQILNLMLDSAPNHTERLPTATCLRNRPYSQLTTNLHA